MNRRLDMAGVVRTTFRLLAQNWILAIAATLLLWTLPNALLTVATAKPISGWMNHLFDIGQRPRMPFDMSSMWRYQASAFMGSIIRGFRGIPAETFLNAVLISGINQRLQGKAFDLGAGLQHAARIAPVLFVALLLRDVAYDIGFLALLVPGLVLAVWTCVLAPVIVVEGAGSALTRCSVLVEGSRWRILGLLVIFSIALSAYAFGERALTASLHTMISAPPWVWMTIGWLAASITPSVSITGAYAIYRELRTLKEGAVDASAVFA